MRPELLHGISPTPFIIPNFRLPARRGRFKQTIQFGLAAVRPGLQALPIATSQVDYKHAYESCR